MAERLRLYVGANELTYSDCVIHRQADSIIDYGFADVVGHSSILSNAVLNIKKKDGSTTIFSGEIREIKRETLWKLKLVVKGRELINKPINKVYTNQSPEDIVDDIITNFTDNLVYASTGTSGVTLEKYIAKGYLIDVIRDMMFVLNWNFRIDKNNNAYFEEEGLINNGRTLTNGTDINISNWVEDPDGIVNHVKVIGGFENIFTEELVSGTGTTFALSHKPRGSFKAVVSSVEQDPSTYTVNAEEKSVTFSGSKTNPTFTYSYDRPVTVEQQDDSSISSYGEIYKEVQAPYLNTLPDARKYAKKFINLHKTPIVMCEARMQSLDFTLEPNEIVNIVDNVRSKSATLVISKITYKASDGSTFLTMGSQQDMEGDWKKEVQERIRKIERRNINQDEDVLARTISHGLRTRLNLKLNGFYASPVDSFILGHKTLGRLRSGFDYEADCSDNSHNGTWNGTGVTAGSQFTTSGWRLSGASFNGSDRYISVGDHADLDLTNNCTFVIAVYLSSLPGAEKFLITKYSATAGYAVMIDSNNKIKFKKMNASVEEGVIATTALTTGAWIHYVIVKSGTAVTFYRNGVSDGVTALSTATIGTNSSNLEIGRYSSNYLSGNLDEAMVFNVALTADEVLEMYQKKFYSNHARWSDCKLWLSMDNPKLGDRIGSQTQFHTEA